MQLRYLTHAEPAWRERGDARLAVKIPRYAGESEQWVEALWCRRLPGGRYELCCIPFWLPDLALGCEVAPDHAELATRLAVCGLPERATLWAMFDRTAAPAAIDEVPAELGALGCLFEWYHPIDFLAVDAATPSRARAAYDLLRRRAARGELRFGKTHVPDIATHRPLAAPHEGGSFVHVRLDQSEPPFRWERLSARQTAPGRFLLTDTPFFARGLAAGHAVETAAEPVELAENAVVRVGARGGRTAFRVQLRDDSMDTAEALLAEVGRLGCRIEWYSTRLAAIDAPRGTAGRLAAFLSRMQAAGCLGFRTSRPRSAGL